MSCKATAGEATTVGKICSCCKVEGISFHAMGSGTGGAVAALETTTGRRMVRTTRGVNDSCPAAAGCTSPLDTDRNREEEGTVSLFRLLLSSSSSSFIVVVVADVGSKCPRKEACRDRDEDTFLLLLVLLAVLL